MSLDRLRACKLARGAREAISRGLCASVHGMPRHIALVCVYICIYTYMYFRNNVKLLRETHVTRLVGNNAGKSDDVVPVSGGAARVHACACRGSEVAELFHSPPSNVVTLVSFALIPALYGRR